MLSGKHKNTERFGHEYLVEDGPDRIYWKLLDKNVVVVMWLQDHDQYCK